MAMDLPKYITENKELGMKRYRAFATFRTNLRILRVYHGLSTEYLGKLLGVRPKRINDFETGRCHPKIDNINKLASEFKVTKTQLLHMKLVVTFLEHNE